MKKIKFIAKAANGIIQIPSKYHKLLTGKLEITVKSDRIESFDTIVDRNLKKYSKVLEKLAKN